MTQVPPRRKRSVPWWVWVLIAIVIALIVWYVLTSVGEDVPAPAQTGSIFELLSEDPARTRMQG